MVDTLWNRLSLDANIIRNYCLLLFKTNNRPYRESNLIGTTALYLSAIRKNHPKLEQSIVELLI